MHKIIPTNLYRGKYLNLQNMWKVGNEKIKNLNKPKLMSIVGKFQMHYSAMSSEVLAAIKKSICKEQLLGFFRSLYSKKKRHLIAVY